ncbi:MAG: hypothetical protein U0525_01940 [Patescibacteria group bacterium]
MIVGPDIFAECPLLSSESEASYILNPGETVTISANIPYDYELKIIQCLIGS